MKRKTANKILVLICTVCLTGALTPFIVCGEGISDIKTDALKSPIKEKWGRDPFIKYEDRLKEKAAGDSPSLLDIKIDGIISDGKKALAIINGGFYRKDEKVNDFLIVAIDKEKVTLEKNGKRFSLGIEKFAIEKSLKGGKK
ncbi:MAG: hypothetical protein LLF28_00860 [Nitrospiraceae bacterium]|nr:hypothetical protein [Nitrospiraceae bacterium]